MSESKKQRAIVFMLTANYHFALAVMLVNLRQTQAQYDKVVVYHNGLSFEQCQALSRIENNIEFILYTLQDWQQEHRVYKGGKQENFLQRFSHFALSKYKIFEQLEYYRQVLFLDLDMVIYGDLSPIFEIQGMAWRTEALFVNKFGSLVGKPDYDGLQSVPNTHPAPNGGLIYADDSIDWRSCLAEARNFINTFSNSFSSVVDELTFSWVAYRFNIPVTELDHRIYNTLPKVFNENTAIVHFMGSEGKVWDNDLMQLAHPVWLQHYATALTYGNFASDKVIKNDALGQILRKHHNQSRWLSILNESGLPSLLPPHLHLSLKLEGESICISYDSSLNYRLLMNRNVDMCKLSLEITNKLMIQDVTLLNNIKALVANNSQLELQQFAHKIIISTKLSYPAEQLGSAWKYFYHTTWVCLGSFI